MEKFNYTYPLQVRYGDLDPQWHVNNARFNTYFEQARTAYLMELGLFDGKSFFDLGLIVADVHISYKNPVALGQQIEIGVRVDKIGSKSMNMSFAVLDVESDAELATSEAIMVGFDYHNSQTIVIPQHWRDKIGAIEGKTF
ncbi:MAG: acyl-CoA thioesterase [Anaerolineaceae bacterium]|nr:acyl-CoA thioesterase [Anaerolineaceae bacterium]